MKIIQITNNIFYYPPDNLRDRPLLGYIRGTRYSLAVDGGFSPNHVMGFYNALAEDGLKEPDYTAITHWHWDHTMGLSAVSGKVICEKRTDKLIAEENTRLNDPSYKERLKKRYPEVFEEFSGMELPQIRLADIKFENSFELDLGGITVRLFHAEAPHTPDSVLVHAPSEEVLFIGDSTCGDFDNGGVMDSTKKAALIRTLEETCCRYIILGHSDPEDKQELIDWLKSN